MNSQLLMLANSTALRAADHLATGIHRHQHHKLTKLKAAFAEVMAGKLTLAQFDAIRTEGRFVLELMAEEHKLLRQEYALDKAAYRATTDVIVRAEINCSVDKIATQMARIRQDAMTLHSAIAVLLARAAEQILQFSADLSLQMPRELGESSPPPVIDTVGVPANDTDAGEVSR